MASEVEDEVTEEELFPDTRVNNSYNNYTRVVEIAIFYEEKNL